MFVVRDVFSWKLDVCLAHHKCSGELPDHDVKRCMFLEGEDGMMPRVACPGGGFIM